MLSLVDILRRIEDGALTPHDAVADARGAIAREDEALGAFVAKDGAAPVGRGPLAGVALGVKDIIDTADLPTEMGSAIYAGWRPKADAPVVARLKGLGATVVGKTATTAFAHLDPAATRNPHDPGHTPGGSSSGSAAAVAAGLVPLALGTQTGGSVIRPAAFCGVAAIKPSFRLIPTVGVKCYSWALDTVGLFAAGTGDLAHALALMTERPGVALSATPPGRFRIGVVSQDFAQAPEDAGLEALERAARAAEAAGAQVTRARLPEDLAQAWRKHGTIQDFEARHALAWEYATHHDRLPPLLRRQLDGAQAVEAAAYDDARRTAHHARRALKDFLGPQGFDVLLTLSAPGRAPRGLASTGDARFNKLWTLMGVPCVTIPVPGEGLPLGVQVVARFGEDGEALAAAHLIETALRRS